MRAVFALVLIAGLGLAGFAVFMAQDFLAGVREENARLKALQADIPDTVPVFIAKEALDYGQALTPEQLTMVRWEKSRLPDGYFLHIPAAEVFATKMEKARIEAQTDKSASQLELEELIKEARGNPLVREGQDARFVLRRTEKHEPVLSMNVTAPGEDAGITSRLQKGYRAFAIRVDVDSGVSGFLRPGDYVDVYWTGQGATESLLGQNVTRLIQDRIKLIAVDQVADTGRTGPQLARTVTVEATPQQVARLAQAQSTGRLSLSLVGAEDDTTIAETVEIDQNTLLDIEVAAPEVFVEEEKCFLTVRKGGEVIKQEMDCTN